MALRQPAVGPAAASPALSLVLGAGGVEVSAGLEGCVTSTPVVLQDPKMIQNDLSHGGVSRVMEIP